MVAGCELPLVGLACCAPHDAGPPDAWLNRYAAKLPANAPAPDIEISDLRGLPPHLLGARD